MERLEDAGCFLLLFLIWFVVFYGGLVVGIIWLVRWWFGV